MSFSVWGQTQRRGTILGQNPSESSKVRSLLSEDGPKISRSLPLKSDRAVGSPKACEAQETPSIVPSSGKERISQNAGNGLKNGVNSGVCQSLVGVVDNDLNRDHPNGVERKHAKQPRAYGIQEGMVTKIRNRHSKVYVIKVSSLTLEISGAICSTLSSSSGKRARKEAALPVILLNTIPSLVGWVYAQMDESFHGHRDRRDDVIHIWRQPNVFILDFVGGKMFKASERFWGNVCFFADKLEPSRKAVNDIEAMRRYLSSVVACTEVHLLFGKKKVLGDVTIRTAIIASRLSVFQHDRRMKDIYQRDALDRLQDVLIHFISISEYVMRCTYIALNSYRKLSIAEQFAREVTQRIVLESDDNNRSTLPMSSTDVLEKLTDRGACMCLRESLSIAQSAFYGCRGGPARDQLS